MPIQPREFVFYTRLLGSLHANCQGLKAVGSGLIWFLSYCFIAIFIGIAFWMSLRLVEAKPGSAFLVEHIFVADYSPAIELNLAQFPPLMLRSGPTEGILV